MADEAICIGPSEARKSYLNQPAVVSAAAHHRLRRGPPGLRLPLGGRRLRRGLRRARPRLHRAAGGGARAVQQQVRGAPHAGRQRAANRAGQPRHHHRPARRAWTRRRRPATRSCSSRRPVAEVAACGWCARRARWRRRCRWLARRRRPPSATTASTSRSGSRRVAPRGGPGAGRPARQRRPPGGAGLQHPASPPEDHRGGAVAGHGRRGARAAARPGHPRRWWPPATRAPARSNSCSTRTATSTSSRSTAGSRSSTR